MDGLLLSEKEETRRLTRVSLVSRPRRDETRTFSPFATKDGETKRAFPLLGALRIEARQFHPSLGLTLRLRFLPPPLFLRARLVWSVGRAGACGFLGAYFVFALFRGCVETGILFRHPWFEKEGR